MPMSITALEKHGREVIAIGEGREAPLAYIERDGWSWSGLLTAYPMRSHVDTLLVGKATRLDISRTCEDHLSLAVDILQAAQP